jgi:hypothetical protein
MPWPVGKKEVNVVLGEAQAIERIRLPGEKKQMLDLRSTWDDISRTLTVDSALQGTGEVVDRCERQILDGGKRMRVTSRFLEGGRSGDDSGDYTHRIFEMAESSANW